jgi:hypothetical protein
MYLPPDPEFGLLIGAVGTQLSQVREITSLADIAAQNSDDAQIARSIEGIQDSLGKLEKSLGDLSTAQVARSKPPSGRLFTLGGVKFGWEDVILALALLIIFVSWAQGSMDSQGALVALLGTGAGGAWGHVAARSIS